jgi:hypothetical protein
MRWRWTDDTLARAIPGRYALPKARETVRTPSRPSRIGRGRRVPEETRPLAHERPSSDQDGSSIVAIVKLIRLSISTTNPTLRKMSSCGTARN